MDEAELIAMIKAGEKAAASALVSMLAADLDEYSRQVGGDLGDLEREVAVENAMKRVVRRIDRYDPTKASLHTWARSFVRNELKELRRSTREIATEDGDIDRPVPDTDSEEEKPLSAATTAMAALVLSLSEADQTLLRLRVFEKLDFEEIAQCLDPPPRADALRKRWERVKAKIAKLAREDSDLRPYTEDEEEK